VDGAALSAVHVNRVLRTLRDSGMVTFRDGFVTFDDYDRLVAFADFESTYLDQIRPLLASVSHPLAVPSKPPVCQRFTSLGADIRRLFVF
jgi:hypothetical protein